MLCNCRLSDMAAEAVTVVVLVALLASVAQIVTAFGFALISVPSLGFVLDVQEVGGVGSILAVAAGVRRAGLRSGLVDATVALGGPGEAGIDATFRHFASGSRFMRSTPTVAG